MKHLPEITSLKKILQISFIVIMGIMVIPTIYSVIVLQIHKYNYDTIITNVSDANNIRETASEKIPAELWNIVCGKKDFLNGNQYVMIHEISNQIEHIKRQQLSDEAYSKLIVAQRALTTLSRNIQIMNDKFDAGSTVTENETMLDEIRTITNLFSDIMQDFIVLEIESANITNIAIKRSSIILTTLQILIIILCLGISINAYISVTQNFGKPLSDMRKLSNEIAKGNLSARTTVPKVDELKPLAQTLNNMAEQIDLLIKKNIEEQQNLQKAEMKALQAQITPHFLYNTFDTIIWLAEEEDTERVVQITKAFSEFLRISLSRGHEWITIQQEVDHIRNYLTIQKIRYNDILNYEIQIDERLNDLKIIKLVLQPLIENAIYHGIKNKRGRGHIYLQAGFTDSTEAFVKFSVKDDGAGFTPERLEEVRKELETDTGSSEQLTSVYGLYNVHKKLCLYYGDKTQGLEIDSKHNEGAEISFVIPVKDL